MADDRYQAWKKFCDKADAQIKSFDGNQHERCPCCGHTAGARWDYDSDYDPHFFIECNNCSCRVTASSWKACLEDWEGHRHEVSGKSIWLLGSDTGDKAMCSKCRHTIKTPFQTAEEAATYWNTELPNFCEECGAKMKENRGEFWP